MESGMMRRKQAANFFSPLPACGERSRAKRAGEGLARKNHQPLTRLSASHFATLSPLRGARERKVRPGACAAAQTKKPRACPGLLVLALVRLELVVQADPGDVLGDAMTVRDRRVRERVGN